MMGVTGAGRLQDGRHKKFPPTARAPTPASTLPGQVSTFPRRGSHAQLRCAVSLLRTIQKRNLGLRNAYPLKARRPYQGSRPQRTPFCLYRTILFQSIFRKAFHQTCRALAGWRRLQLVDSCNLQPARQPARALPPASTLPGQESKFPWRGSHAQLRCVVSVCSNAT